MIFTIQDVQLKRTNDIIPALSSPKCQVPVRNDLTTLRLISRISLLKNQLFADLYRVVKATFAEPCMVSALKQ
ncbi:hypothetical protein Pan161_40520 [Gimesia algae]|uniref:Uncharacterized protein n=1 Tax=Gimesia algae TaxID=2527971 RepID=A0A517VHC3_9PLAN|nr:hypothetical protein Pan161_40520 [Gimesia algae]